jgi:uncharacterized protein
MTTEQMTVLPPMPEVDRLTQFFWDGVNNHRLLILRCESCGHYIHWPREMCRVCLSVDLRPTEVSGRGKLETWTMVYQPYHPFFFDKVPYSLCVVELVEQEDLKLVTNVVNCAEADLRIDLPVEVTFREIAPGLTLPQFQPVGATVGTTPGGSGR